MTSPPRITRRSITMHQVPASRAPRCEHTLITKPECHCPACLAEQIAAHCPQPPAVAPTEARRAAA